jgi:DNA modification methylase
MGIDNGKEVLHAVGGNNSITLFHGDCLEVMKDIEAGSVDMILADPPYG